MIRHLLASFGIVLCLITGDDKPPNLGHHIWPLMMYVFPANVLEWNEESIVKLWTSSAHRNRQFWWDLWVIGAMESEKSSDIGKSAKAWGYAYISSYFGGSRKLLLSVKSILGHWSALYMFAVGQAAPTHTQHLPPVPRALVIPLGQEELMGFSTDVRLSITNSNNQASITCHRGATVHWTDQLKGSVVTMCGNLNFSAVALLGGRLHVSYRSLPAVLKTPAPLKTPWAHLQRAQNVIYLLLSTQNNIKEAWA